MGYLSEIFRFRRVLEIDSTQSRFSMQV